MERVKRLAGNEIELGMMIPMIESRATNIPMTKGMTYVVMRIFMLNFLIYYTFFSNIVCKIYSRFTFS